MSNECPICINTYNYHNSKITCVYCEFDCCKNCFKYYIEDSDHYLQCMNSFCHKEFNRTTIYKYLGAEYVNTKYKSIRENVLYNIEKRLIQTTQLMLDKENKMQEIRDEVNQLPSAKFLEELNLKDELKSFKSSTELKPIAETISEYNNILDNLNSLDEKYHDMRMVLYKELEDIKNDNIKINRTYTKKCPNFNCHAMLSLESITKYDNFLCSMCNMVYCKTCNEYIQSDEIESTHECNEDIIKNLEQINIDSKSCPSCGITIYKSEGCFDKSTVIPLYDGTNKMVAELRENDILIGDDNTPRRIVKLINGNDMLYKVEQSNGIYYIVNSQHKLCLISKTNKYVNLSVSDFLNLPEQYRSNLMGYKVIDSNLIKSELTITEYKCDNFYGFELDGNHKFILTDNTVVHNCDQMYCVSCHTPFSWKSLKIISNQHIHNPHYFEYIKTVKGFNERDPLDIICGREINDDIIDKLINNFNKIIDDINDNDTLSKKIKKDSIAKLKKMEMDVVVEFANIVMHLRRNVIPTYRTNNRFTSNNKYRVALLKNEITIDNFKVKIQRSDKTNQKKQEILDIVVMFNTCCIDIIYRLVYAEPINLKLYESIVNELHKLKIYVNNCLKEVSKVFNITYKPIDSL